MHELLVELGCEELPATAVQPALRQLADELTARLDEAHLTHGAVEIYGTPRRLIVAIHDVLDRQPDRQKEMRGPAQKAAFDADGNPTPALLGFCRGQGVEASSVRREGDYVWVTKTILGRPAAEVLAEAIPSAIRALTFEKSMRWGASRMRFARPIRWILASFGGECVPFTIETVTSGLNSRGHRFLAPEEFEAKTLSALLSGLRERFVEPDANARRERILEGARAVATGTPEIHEELLDENVHLTEWPMPIAGEFREEFMVLPEPVLITAMAKHERFFPVRDGSGRITRQFISVRNSGEEATVRQGNAWVLNARFNDAKFFFDEDSKSDLAEFLGKTERMLFQEKLGTVRSRADRLAQLAGWLSDWTGGTAEDRSRAERAGLLAKADLATGLVSELSSLQGVIGGEYARREGEHEAVCHAISVQYSPTKAAAPETEAGRVARCVILADQLDKLAGYLGLGLAPSGSSDPFGLRRAVTILLDVAWGWGAVRRSYREAIEQALAIYAQQGHALDAEACLKALREVFQGRYKALLADERYDALDAALLLDAPDAVFEPRAVQLRLRVLDRMAQDVAWVQTATRPLNLVGSAVKKGIAIPDTVDASKLDSESGSKLWEQVQAATPAVQQALDAEDASALESALRPLQSVIHDFFETTMVMAEDEQVRLARLALLRKVTDLLRVGGDWTLLVQA